MSNEHNSIIGYAIQEDMKRLLEKIATILEKKSKSDATKEVTQEGKNKPENLFDATFNLMKSLPRIIKGDLSSFTTLPNKLAGLFQSAAGMKDGLAKTLSKSNIGASLLGNILKSKSAGTAEGEDNSSTTNTSTSSQQSVVSRAFTTISNVGKSIFQAGKSFLKGSETGAAEAGAGEAAGAAGAAEAGAAGAAGAGEAAAGGAEAAAAAGEGIAALASNPVGWVIAAIAAIVAVTAAMVALPFIVSSFAESLLDAQRKFGEASGAMAQVFARKEVFEVLRNQRMGNALAPSAARLENAQEALLTKLEPYIVGMYDALNEVLTVVVNLTSAAMDIVNEVVKIAMSVLKLLVLPELLIDFFSWVRSKWGGGDVPAGKNISTWFGDMATEYDRRRRAGEVAREVRIIR